MDLKEQLLRSPSGKKLSAAESQKALLTLTHIDETHTKIKTLSEENAHTHENVIKLRHGLTSITKAMSKNIEMMQTLISDLEEKNESLRDEYEERIAISSKIQGLIDKCASAGIDIVDIPGLDAEKLSQHFDIPIPSLEKDELNPVIKHIVKTNRYFRMCKTDNDFIERVNELYEETKKQPDPFHLSAYGQEKSRRVEILRKELAALQQANSIAQAKRASELSKLHARRQKLILTLKDIKENPQRQEFKPHIRMEKSCAVLNFTRKDSPILTAKLRQSASHAYFK